MKKGDEERRLRLKRNLEAIRDAAIKKDASSAGSQSPSPSQCASILAAQPKLADVASKITHFTSDIQNMN